MAETPLRRQYNPASKRTKLTLIAQRRLRRERGQRSNRFKFLLLAAFLVPIFMCSLNVLRIGSNDYQGDTTRLQALLPLLEELKVENYFNKDWCKGISYGRGMFSEAKHGDSAENCSLFSGGGATKPFDNPARQDFELLGKALEATNMIIYDVEDVTFNASGAVVHAVFHKDCGFCRTRYVYSPNYDKLPREVSGEIWHTKINANWYLTEEDWP